MTHSVYKFYDGSGRLLYVGITGRGVRRQFEHERSKHWWSYVAGQTVEHCDNKSGALFRERELIEQHAPPFNKTHNPNHQAIAETYEEDRRDIAAAGSVTKRRSMFYAISKAQKAKFPCVVCLRPMVRTGRSVAFPSCDECYQDELDKGWVWTPEDLAASVQRSIAEFHRRSSEFAPHVEGR